MKKIALGKLMDMMDDIKKIDAMILLHQNLDDSDFMVSQYEAKKYRLMSRLIDELVTSPVQSAQSFSFIQMLLGKYYPAENQHQMPHDETIDQLVAAL